MRTRGAFLAITIGIICLASLWLPQSVRAEESGMTVSRMVTSTDVADREPVGVANTFPASVNEVYCFLEARSIRHNTEVSMVWYYEGNETALVTLLLKPSNRWRTWSSKKIAGRVGHWKVSLQDADGNEISAVDFTVE